MKNTEIETYLEEIRKAIYNMTDSETFIESLRQQLYDYAEDFPDLTLEKLHADFGEPDSIAREFLEESRPTNPKKLAKRRRFEIVKSVLIGVLIVVVICGIIRFIDIQRNQQVMATDVIVIENE